MTPNRSGQPSARAERFAPVFAALGDATRLQIVTRLRNEGPLSIVRLTEETHVSRQAVTKHLRTLESADLVHGERAGRERVWKLRQRRLDELRRYVDEISAQWDQAIDRLRSFVEKP
ncbi:MAG: metalloregulator ArsR/SmtB family transcription factor [Gammaproteobacteria bacterium]